MFVHGIKYGTLRRLVRDLNFGKKYLMECHKISNLAARTTFVMEDELLGWSSVTMCYHVLCHLTMSYRILCNRSDVYHAGRHDVSALQKELYIRRAERCRTWLVTEVCVQCGDQTCITTYTWYCDHVTWTLVWTLLDLRWTVKSFD